MIAFSGIISQILGENNSQMRVILIRPPDTDVLDAEKDPPLNLLFLASALRQQNVDVQIMDLGNAPIESVISVPYADVFGITAPTAAYPDAAIFTRLLRAIYPKSKFVLGGAHANAISSSVDMNIFDVVAVGECEKNILQILTSTGKVNGLYPEDLSTLYPLPWDLVEMEKYIGKRQQNGITVLFGRGCKFNCRFCYNSASTLPVRFPSAKTVQGEIELLVDRYGIDRLNVIDDNGGLYIKKYLKILQNVGVKWTYETTIASLFDRDSVKDTTEAGCERYAIGVESGSDKVLMNMGKPHRKAQAKGVIEKIKRYDASVRLFMLAGFPGETWETVKETIEFVKSLPLDERDEIRLNCFVPYPGTEPYAFPERYGIKWISKNWRDFRSKGKERQFRVAFETWRLSSDEILRMCESMENALVGAREDVSFDSYAPTDIVVPASLWAPIARSEETF